MKCQCEHESHFHGIEGSEDGCTNEATVQVDTMYGPYQMCAQCADSLPVEYLEPEDPLPPPDYGDYPDDYPLRPFPESRASRAEQNERYIDCGPAAWDDSD